MSETSAPDRACKVLLVDVPRIDATWPHVAEGFEKARARTGSSLDTTTLWAECRSGAAFLLIVMRDDAVIGAGVFRFDKWPTGLKLRCVAMYGRDMKSWLEPWTETVKHMMRIGGANGFIFDEGRRGWRRMLGAKLLWGTYEVSDG